MFEGKNEIFVILGPGAEIHTNKFTKSTKILELNRFCV